MGHADHHKSALQNNCSYDTGVPEDGGQKFPPPKYFDRLKAEDDPEFMEALKKKRRDFAEAAMKAKLEKTSLDEHDYLAVAESAKASKIKSLRRDQI